MTRTAPTIRLAALGVVLVGLALGGCATQRAVTPEEAPLPATNHYAIETALGTLVVELSDETPVHRDNFKKLVAEGFYDGTTFHRVIAGFMVQGGDPNSKDDDPANDGQGGPGYTLPAEIVPTMTHEVGALAAARQGDAVNPERRSSGSQFYLVSGDRARHLDGDYTVFGRLVEGFEVLERLQSVPTPRSTGRAAPPALADRPIEAVPMTVRPLPDFVPEG